MLAWRRKGWPAGGPAIPGVLWGPGKGQVPAPSAVSPLVLSNPPPPCPGRPALLCRHGFRLHTCLESLDQVAIVRGASSGVRAAGGWGYMLPETRHSWLLSWQRLAAQKAQPHPHPGTAPGPPPSSVPAPHRKEGLGAALLRTQDMESARPASALIGCTDEKPNLRALVSPSGKWARDHF